MRDSLFSVFNASHTALWLKIRQGAKWHEYLTELKAANKDASRFSLMLRNWGDPVV